MWWQLVAGAAGGLLFLWMIMVGLFWRVQRREHGRTHFRDLLRLIPDVVRLLHRLAADSTLPRAVRIRLWLLLVYLVSPVDLIPDFVPVLGYADDAIVVAVAIRSVVRRAGIGALRRHWPGTNEGLAALLVGVGLSSTPLAPDT